MGDIQRVNNLGTLPLKLFMAGSKGYVGILPGLDAAVPAAVLLAAAGLVEDAAAGLEAVAAVGLALAGLLAAP